MKLLWQIEDSDIQKVKAFYETQKNNAFVLNRVERNVKRNLPPFSKELKKGSGLVYWRAQTKGGALSRVKVPSW